MSSLGDAENARAQAAAAATKVQSLWRGHRGRTLATLARRLSLGNKVRRGEEPRQEEEEEGEGEGEEGRAALVPALLCPSVQGDPVMGETVRFRCWSIGADAASNAATARDHVLATTRRARRSSREQEEVEQLQEEDGEEVEAEVEEEQQRRRQCSRRGASGVRCVWYRALRRPKKGLLPIHLLSNKKNDKINGGGGGGDNNNNDSDVEDEELGEEAMWWTRVAWRPELLKSAGAVEVLHSRGDDGGGGFHGAPHSGHHLVDSEDVGYYLMCVATLDRQHLLTGRTRPRTGRQQSRRESSTFPSVQHLDDRIHTCPTTIATALKTNYNTVVCFVSTHRVVLPIRARQLIGSALTSGGASVEVEQMVTSTCTSYSPLISQTQPPPPPAAPAAPAATLSNRGVVGDDLGDDNDDDVEENHRYRVSSYKPLVIEMDTRRVRLRGREGRVKSDQPYGANTWVKPVGRRYFVVCVGPPPFMSSSLASSATCSNTTTLRYCRAPSRQARDLLVATFRSFAGGTGAFFSQALGPPSSSASPAAACCSLSVERDIRELKAALAVERSAAAARMQEAGDAFAVKSERLLSESRRMASHHHQDQGSTWRRNCSAAAQSPSSVAGDPYRVLPVAVLRALAKTYFELASLARNEYIVSAFTR